MSREQSDPETATSPTGERSRGRLGTLLILAVGLLAGLAGGVYWHNELGGWVGLGGRHAPDAAGGAPKQLWTCGMHPQVIQDKPGACPICGMALEPLATGAPSGPATAGERKIKYWWDPMMNPPYISDKPGKSPMGMDLVPVYDDQISGGTAITIDPAVVQNMGVRVAQVTRGPLRQSIRAVGYLEQPQPGIHDVNMRISGWIEKLFADTEGMLIKQGQPLFELYSPEVQTGIEELIIARKAADALPSNAGEDARKMADAMMHAAHRKLEQWGLKRQQIEELAKLDRAPRTITFVSPATGEVAAKMIVAGSMIKMGERAMQILDRSTLWLDAQVYAQDLPFVQLGQPVAAAIEGMPGQSFDGEVIFINPRVDTMTRATTVRVALPNPRMTLRSGMYATARIEASRVDDALLVPREAILDSGTRQVVFVSLPRGHFEPRKVKLGLTDENDRVQILEGLAPGETIVLSGQFLMDAESRMKEAIQKHLSEKLLSQAPGPPASAPDHRAHGTPATGLARIKGSPQWHGGVDATVAAYLKLAAALGAVEAADTPLDAAELGKAAAALRQQAGDDAQRTLAENIAKAADALARQPLARQRELFKPLSDAVIDLVDQSPPTRKVGPKLYVLYCPMAPGQWLQDRSQSANPYYAKEMKQCAELTRIIDTAAE